SSRVHQEWSDNYPCRDQEEPSRTLQFSSPHGPGPPKTDEQDYHREVGHHPHRPILDEHIRDVVARSVLLLVLGIDLVETLHLPIPVVGREQREDVWNLEDLSRRLVLIAAADLKERERARLTGVPLGLGRGDLHRLVLRFDHTELATDEQCED